MGIWVSFCADSGAGWDSPAGPWLRGLAATRCPSLHFPSIPLPGASSPDRLGDRGALGEPVSWAWKERAEPCCPPGVRRVGSAFLLAAKGQPNTTTLSRRPPPGLLAAAGVPARGRPAPRLLFPVGIALQPTLSRSAPQESEPGRGTRKSLQIRPRQGLSASAPPLRGDRVVAECGSGPQGPLG